MHSNKTGPLARMILQTGLDGYESVENMEDHWHLHEFDKTLLRQVIGDSFQIERIVGVPFPHLPLRFVARLRPR